MFYQEACGFWNFGVGYYTVLSNVVSLLDVCSYFKCY